MIYREFFHDLTGCTPFPYQERLSDEIASGESVILRVPTGAGKTWAAVAPFLFGLKNRKPLGDRLVYALPLRSLASSLYATVLDKMQSSFAKVVTTGKDRDYGDSARYCSLQIGGQKNDPFFEADLVFTTIDQVLSAYVFLPVSLPRRLGNINAGALIGSVLVFDEVHLLDPSVALGTTIEMLHRLNGLCQFILMTATMSDDAVQWLAKKLGAKVAQIHDEEIRALPSQRTKQRTWQWNPEPLNAETIRTRHRGGRTIAIANSVGRAQQLFLELKRLYEAEPNNPDLILLHARYYPEDRKDIEDRLADYFGPKAVRTNIILVTTQVIEAGMDISADDLHTELAPMNALIQRAGRTARYEDRKSGTVTVYESKSLGPYKELGVIVDSTRQKLAQLPVEGRHIDFVEERYWVQDVHATSEEQQFAQYSNLYSRRQSVHEAMDQGNPGKLTELVRNINSVGVLISDGPETLDFNGRTWPRLLGVAGISLMSLRKYFENLQPGQWVAKGATEDASQERPGLGLRWEDLSANELLVQWLVALHPNFASYGPELGLVLGRPGPALPIEMAEVPATTRYQYEFELWSEHARRITKQARTMKPFYIRSKQLLSRRYAVPGDLIEELVEVTCALHDSGKLTTEWQRCAWQWQNDKDTRIRAAGFDVPVRPRYPLAHTCFDPVADRRFQGQLQYRFPPHAVQGAYAVAPALEQHLINFGVAEWAPLAAACAFSAIARHHGARAKEATIFKLDSSSVETVQASLPLDWRAIGLVECEALVHAKGFTDRLLAFAREEDEPGWALYAFLVRRLRLADQESLKKSSSFPCSCAEDGKSR